MKSVIAPQMIAEVLVLVLSSSSARGGVSMSKGPCPLWSGSLHQRSEVLDAK